MSRRPGKNPHNQKTADVAHELPGLRIRAERAVAQLRETRARMAHRDDAPGQSPRIGSFTGRDHAREVAVHDVIIQALSIADSELAEYRVIDGVSGVVIAPALASFSSAYDEALRLTHDSDGRIWQESRDKRGRPIGARTLVPSRR